jgi:hypothetical protein
MRKKENNIYKDKSPLDIIYQEGGKIDLPCYDLLYERFLNGDWGKGNKPRTPLQVS